MKSWMELLEDAETKWEIPSKVGGTEQLRMPSTLEKESMRD